MGMKNVIEAGIRCDLLRDTLRTAERTAMENMGTVQPHLGAKRTGQCELPCGGSGDGCPVRIKVTYNADQVTKPNPYGTGEVTGYDLVHARETIQVNKVDCIFGEDIGN